MQVAAGTMGRTTIAAALALLLALLALVPTVGALTLASSSAVSALSLCCGRDWAALLGGHRVGRQRLQGQRLRLQLRRRLLLHMQHQFSEQTLLQVLQYVDSRAFQNSPNQL